jgi:hypothetical protein
MFFIASGTAILLARKGFGLWTTIVRSPAHGFSQRKLRTMDRTGKMDRIG